MPLLKVYHILPELKLRRIFLAVYFVNKNLPEESVQVYWKRTTRQQLIYFQETKYWLLYGKAKCNILQWKIQRFKQFCYAENLAYYTLENKSNKTCEYYPDEFDDNLIENNHEDFSYPSKIKLMITGETMRWCKVKRILWYHAPNKLLASEKFAN